MRISARVGRTVLVWTSIGKDIISHSAGFWHEFPAFHLRIQRTASTKRRLLRAGIINPWSSGSAWNNHVWRSRDHNIRTGWRARVIAKFRLLWWLHDLGWSAGELRRVLLHCRLDALLVKQQRRLQYDLDRRAGLHLYVIMAIVNNRQRCCCCCSSNPECDDRIARAISHRRQGRKRRR